MNIPPLVELRDRLQKQADKYMRTLAGEGFTVNATVMTMVALQELERLQRERDEISLKAAGY